MRSTVVIKLLLEAGVLVPLYGKSLFSQETCSITWVDNSLFPSVGFRWMSFAGDCECVKS